MINSERIHPESDISNTRLRWVIIIISLSCLLLVWVLVIWSSIDERSNLEEQSRDELTSISLSVNDQTVHILSTVHLFLQLADAWITRHPSLDPRNDPEFREMIQLFRINNKHQIDIRLIDPKGNIFVIPDTDLPSQSDNDPETWVGDRDYFQSQALVSTKGFFIGRPVKSRLSDNWVLPVSYPLSRSTAVSVIVASIDLSPLQIHYESLRPKPDGSISMFRSDGILLASAPIDEPKIGAFFSGGAAWQQFYARSLQGNTAIPLIGNFKFPTVRAWSHSPDFPVVAVVTNDLQDVNDAWRHLILTRAALVLVLSIVVIILLIYLFRLMRRQDSGLRELETFARIDTLTGLLNRRYFLLRGEEELTRASRYQRPLSLVMLDLDHFKQINDKLGHAAGDDVLRAFSRVINAILRESDLIGRIGGEEFVVIMPETDIVAAREISERMRVAINTISTRIGSLSASLGIAVWKGAPESMQKLLKRADSAMYAAKKAGRNRIVVDVGLSGTDDIEVPDP